MSDKTQIEWTDATWNIVHGCTRVSSGCDHCYIERTPPFRMAGRRFDAPGVGGTTAVTLLPDKLLLPLRWRKPRRIFVSALADLFHDTVPDEFIAQVFAVMAAADHHTFQVLTKRHARMRSLLNSSRLRSAVHNALVALPPSRATTRGYVLPLANVWLGVSAENQHWADIRIPALLDTPAAIRWISAEPLLGPINLNGAALRPYERQQGGYWDYAGADVHGEGKTWIPAPPAQLDWVVVGGESGPKARPMHPAWARQLRDQCEAAGIPFFFKQWGDWVAPDQMPESTFMDWDIANGTSAYDRSKPWRAGKKAAGRELDGQTWDQYPGGAQ